MPTEAGSMPHLTQVIDLNHASESELANVPAIGPERAHNIVAYREQHGPFSGLEDLKQVPGIERNLVDDLRLALAVEGRRT